MFEFMDANKIVSIVELKKGYDPDKTCLLVEGRDDKLVYKKFVSKDDCEIIDCHGKENLKPAIDSLDGTESIKGYLAIKDSDFDIFDGCSLSHNLMLTDGHDLEVMIMTTEALEHVIEVRIQGETEDRVNTFKSLIRARLFELGSVIGYLRFVSCRCSWGINIQTGRFLQHLNSDCKLSLGDAINELKTTHPEIDKSQIRSTEFKELSASHSHHLCQGHDMELLLSKIFSKIAKKHFRKKINLGSDLSDRLFLAFGQTLFQTTLLYKRIKEWEANNQPYRVLKE